jgi:Glycosyl transferase family 2
MLAAPTSRGRSRRGVVLSATSACRDGTRRVSRTGATLPRLASRADPAGLGAVVIDDASRNGCDEALADACSALGDRITLVKRRRHVGLLANLVLAVRDFVSRPEAIVVTLDLDDALAPGALAHIVREHDLGAEVTVGSMIRSDKESRYEINFADPRHGRGGNVWQRARSFRKRLFDQIELADLRVDSRYIDIATDWAYMLPIVELAKKPVWIEELCTSRRSIATKTESAGASRTFVHSSTPPRQESSTGLSNLSQSSSAGLSHDQEAPPGDPPSPEPELLRQRVWM